MGRSRAESKNTPLILNFKRKTSAAQAGFAHFEVELLPALVAQESLGVLLE